MSANTAQENETTSPTVVKKTHKKASALPPGKPKSGRFWKTPKTKFSAMVKTRGLKSSFESKQALRLKLKQIRAASQELKAKKKDEEEARKERRRENIKRQQENLRKSEVVQIISNTNKLKRMKKKQLRSIEKRDTVNMK